MSDKTSIEWTDATWNPLVGCSRVSAGCQHCYAERHAYRFARQRGSVYEGTARRVNGKPTFTGRVNLNPRVLDQPLRWRVPRRIFVNSMSDLFHENVPDQTLDDIFAVMASAPQHTFQVLTKRLERMLDYVGAPVGTKRDMSHALWRVHGDNPKRVYGAQKGWPLPNVWLGVSVEDQAAADARIPLLLQTPAAVRFLSCEPLLGPIDLSGWGDARAIAPNSGVTKIWSEYTWPTWIPQRERELIERFWAESYHRGPRAWMEDNEHQSTPGTGMRVGFVTDSDGWIRVVPARSPLAEGHGRYVHRWNNIGVVVTEDGAAHHCSSAPGPGWLARWRCRDRVYRHQLHWVIAGGESGPGARPMHPDWARSLRDQCAAADVPFFFKQWGEWAPDEAFTHMPRSDAAMHEWIGTDGQTVVNHSWRYGKKVAGHLLDGVEHHAFPRASHA